jgi:nitroreductase
MPTTPGSEVLKEAVRLACRAPSILNSQPWRWEADGGTLRLFVDRSRLVPGTDRSGRQAIISCGCALDHVRVAMLAAGWDAVVERFPNPNDPDHLASIEFRHAEHITGSQDDRAQAILLRRTDRLPLAEPTFWTLFEPVLRGALEDVPVTIDVLTDDARPQLAAASQLSATLRRDDYSYHEELAWWTSRFVVAGGLPPSALVSDEERPRVEVARDFPGRSHQSRRPEVEVDWSKILLLSTPEDTRADALSCGETLSAVLLECTMAGLGTCPLTHLIEVDECRDIVRGLVDGLGQPQVLIRVGVAPPMEAVPPPTPRHPLEDVLQIV